MAATLTLVAIQARKVIRYGIYGFVLFLIGRFIFLTAIDLYRASFPPAPPPPTVGFGRLTAIPFPEPDIELPELRYKLETPTGNLPEFPTQMRVYYIPLKTSNLFSFDRMIQKAGAFGFSATPRQRSETLYVFSHPTLPSTFEIDLVTEAFSLSFNLAADSTPLNNRAPDVQSALNISRQQLQRANSYPADLTGQTTHEFLRVEGQNLVRALALSDGQLTKINFYRKPFEQVEGQGGYPSVTANPKQSNVWFIVSGSREREKQLIAGEYRYFEVDETRFETYPTKSAAEAYEELRNGRGYIANLGLNTLGDITIREVSIAYYDPNVPYTFYQPVIVFRGDGEFVAYVPLISKEYYGEAPEASN